MRKLTARERVRLLRALALGGRLLRSAPRWDPERMRAWQLARVRALADHAFRTVPLYRERYGAAGYEPGALRSWEDFRSLPVIAKEDLCEAGFDGALSAGCDRAALVVSRSSGSSGRVLDVAYAAETLIAYVLASLRIYGMGFAYRPWHRHVYVYTSPYPIDSIFGLYPLRFVSTLEPVGRILDVLVAERPHLVVAYPSHLRRIAEEATPAQLAAVRPRLVSVSSEMSSQAERDHLAGVFGCPALDNYSSEELARIAAQCRHGTYHVFEDMNLVEVLDGDGKPAEGLGTVVGTNLHNAAMPLIRYRQNDLAELGPPGCACGWRFRTLRRLEGRRNDSFVLPSGRELTSGFLLDATYDFLLRHRSAARDFCLVQEAPDSVLLELVPGRGLTPAVKRDIAARFRGFLEPGVAFRVEEVAECEKTRTGKRNPILRRRRGAGTAQASGEGGGRVRAERSPLASGSAAISGGSHS